MMRYKKQGSVILMLVLFCGLILCFHLPANAKQNVKISRKKVVLTTGKSKKLKLDGAKKKKKIRWKSSDKKVVSVSKNGKIKAKKNGSAVVTACYQNKKYKWFWLSRKQQRNRHRKKLHRERPITGDF